RRSGVGVDDDALARSRPRAGHQLRLGPRASVTGPAAEQHHVAGPRLALGAAEPLDADRVKVCPGAVRITADGDQARARHLPFRRRRQTPYISSVAVTVATSCTAFFPCSLDSPTARSRMSTGTSTTVMPASWSRSSDSTSGAPLSYGSARIGIAFASTA